MGIRNASQCGSDPPPAGSLACNGPKALLCAWQGDDVKTAADKLGMDLATAAGGDEPPEGADPSDPYGWRAQHLAQQVVQVPGKSIDMRLVMRDWTREARCCII